jgi:hypothetical protein
MMRLLLNRSALFAAMAWPLALLQISACQMTPLTAAARDGDVAAIYRLLESGAKVDETPEGKWRAPRWYW